MLHRRVAAALRFSSLGDVLLAGHLPVFLKQVDPERSVVFVTKARYAGLLDGHPAIDRVYALRGESADPSEAGAGVLGSLRGLVAALRADGVGEIFDLHRNWRSSRILAAFPKAKRVAAPKYALRRRLWVYARWLHPEPVPPLLHTYRSLAGLPPSGEPEPWLKHALSDEELDRAADRLGEDWLRRGFVLMGIGARWETKRWPAAHFADLARRLERERGLPTLFAVTPEEPVPDAIASYLSARREAPVQLPFRELAAVAAYARGIVSNDSGVLHLGPALGVPAVGVFGSTVPELGFARQSPRDEVAEIRLWCRPCGVHGRKRCPLGHHACMQRLDPEIAYQALGRALDKAPLAPYAAEPSRA